jgi:membrane protein implicated in regulation of membrane protease activity
MGQSFESDVDSDIDLDSHDGHFNIDPGFTLFSVRSIIAFFTFFGWVGVITLHKGMDLKLVILVSFFAGLIALFFVAFVLFQLIKLAEEGTVDMEEALGKYGKVYIPIPEKRTGTGLVNIELSNKIMELRAITDGDRLPTGTIIYVFKILEDNVLLVGEITDNKD